METTKIYELTKEINLFPYQDFFPILHDSVFVASGAKIIGDVQIGKDSSIWYNVVVRGDVHFIRIGSMTNIQDSSMIHVTNKKFPTIIGDNVTVGHSVTLHGCILKNLCLIGMGAVILDGAVVETKSMVAAGTVVKPGFVCPTGKLIAGVPGKVIRDLTQTEMDDFEASTIRYRDYTKITIDSLKKIYRDKK
ncbi:MAG: gamma carbonic anhydrase family protein [Chlorobiaceae bacterium]|nr:gamma carbonic anhydrase family protein [Chlorobiaceae bacterium]MBA4308746.1 gamma carbonic anhydrase family protein [Chlorobiaceae bacterium]